MSGFVVVLDLPTGRGWDSDDPRARGEVGKKGVAIDTLADVEDLFDGIDCAKVKTVMTVDGPAAIVMAMYVAAAEKAGTPRSQQRGMFEYDTRSRQPATRLATDLIRFTTAEMPRWRSLSIVAAGSDGKRPPNSPILPIASTVADAEERQLQRLAETKRARNLDAVDAALRRIESEAAAPDANLMPALIEAAHAYATVGEIGEALAHVLGRWTEDPVI